MVLATTTTPFSKHYNNWYLRKESQPVWNESLHRGSQGHSEWPYYLDSRICWCTFWCHVSVTLYCESDNFLVIRPMCQIVRLTGGNCCQLPIVVGWEWIIFSLFVMPQPRTTVQKCGLRIVIKCKADKVTNRRKSLQSEVREDRHFSFHNTFSFH